MGVATEYNPSQSAKSRTEYKRDWKRRKKEAERAARTPEQREAAELAEMLKSVSARYPTLKGELNDFLYILHQRVHQSPDRVKDGILKALEWPADIEDLCEQLGYSELIVLNTLECMRSCGVAEEVPRGRVNKDGVQPMVWRLTGSPSKSPHVLP